MLSRSPVETVKTKGAMFWAVLAGVAAAGPFAAYEEARACGLGPGLVLMNWPVDGARDIPTDTAFFFETHPAPGRELRFTVRTASGSSTVSMTSIGRWDASPVPGVPIPSFGGNVIEALTAKTPLDPLSEYEVLTSALQDGVEFWQRTYRFRTGSGPTTEAPRHLLRERLFYHRAFDGPVLFDSCSNAEVDEITEAFLTLSASSIGALVTAEAVYPASASYLDMPKAEFAVPFSEPGLVRHAFFGRSTGPVCIMFRVIDGVGRTSDSMSCDVEACASGLDPYRWNTEQWEIGGSSDCSPFLPPSPADAGPSVVDGQAADFGGGPDVLVSVDSGGANDRDGGPGDVGPLQAEDGCACALDPPSDGQRRRWTAIIWSLLLGATGWRLGRRRNL